MSKVIEFNPTRLMDAEKALVDLQWAVTEIGKQDLAELIKVFQSVPGGRENIIQLLDAERCKLWMLIEDLRYHMGKRTK